MDTHFKTTFERFSLLRSCQHRLQFLHVNHLPNLQGLFLISQWYINTRYIHSTWSKSALIGRPNEIQTRRSLRFLPDNDSVIHMQYEFQKTFFEEMDYFMPSFNHSLDILIICKYQAPDYKIRVSSIKFVYIRVYSCITDEIRVYSCIYTKFVY